MNVIFDNSNVVVAEEPVEIKKEFKAVYCIIFFSKLESTLQCAGLSANTQAAAVTPLVVVDIK